MRTLGEFLTLVGYVGRWVRRFWDWEVERNWDNRHNNPYPYPNIYMGRLIVSECVALILFVAGVALVSLLP